MKAFFIRNVKRLSITTLIVILLISALSRIVSAGLAGLPDEALDPTDAPYDRNALLCPPSDEVSMLITQIGQRGEDLTNREMTVALREQDIAVARQEIEGALARLTEAEERLAARMQQSSTAADTDVDQLVRVYEGMKPKEAAVLFEAMEPAFAAGFLTRMSADAASALFSNLSPEKAYALSVIMAGRNANAAKE
mgnify:FL=1